MSGFVFLSSCGDLGTGKIEWKKYDVADGNFAVLFPTPPTTQKTTENLEGEQIEVTLVMSEMGAVAYGVMYCDFPGGNVFSDSPQDLFDSVQADLVKEHPGAIVSTKKVSLDRFTGREIQLATSDGIRFLRLFFVRFRLFQVLAVVPTESSRVDVNKFLNSFRLLRT
jgi:hypothetical protein